MKDWSHLIIKNIYALDIRFPTSKTSEGTDAVHTNCNYSAAYVNIIISDKLNKVFKHDIYYYKFN